jgi:hypothetical protein
MHVWACSWLPAGRQLLAESGRVEPPILVVMWEIHVSGSSAELGKVTLKTNGDEALSDESPQKSNADEAFNDDFPEKVTPMKRLTLNKKT